jgi:uncharacterized membrane protein YphA (DoxX/SURF4 family)
LITDPAQTPISAEPASPNIISQWHPLVRAVLRFVYAYIFLYAIYTLTNTAAFLAVPFLKGRFVFPVDDAFSGLVPWTGLHILHLRQPITYNLSGDSPFSWIEHLLFLVIAFAAALLWWAIDRKRPHYRRLDQWLRLLVRFALASILFGYGFDKVFPLQFHSITRYDLVQPFGEFNHFSLMWHFMAASKPYTIFSGLLEVAAGVLLLVPPLAGVGALVSVVVLTNVVALNFAYNIPVKLHSSNYLLLAIFLSAPLLPRLFRLLVLNRNTPREVPVPLSKNARIDRLVRTVPIVLGALIFITFFFEQRAHYAHVQSVEAAVVPLQGIWQVDQFSYTGGIERPLLTAKLAAEMQIPPGDDRWFRLIFDRPGEMVIQSLDGKVDLVDLALDKTAKTATLTDSGDADWKVSLTIDQPQAKRLHLQGTVNGVAIDATLHRLDESGFPIKDEGLHLVNR